MKTMAELWRSDGNMNNSCMEIPDQGMTLFSPAFLISDK
jgi:hypothetical protein